MIRVDDAKREAEMAACEHDAIVGEHYIEIVCSKCGKTLMDSRKVDTKTFTAALREIQKRLSKGFL